MTKLFPVLVVMITTLVSVIGDTFLKHAADKGWRDAGLFSFLIGLFFYVLTAFFWVASTKLLKLSSVGVIYSLCSILFITLSGVVVFHERLNTVEIVGILLAAVSIFLLARFS